jgi:hypothetical protein
MLALDVSRERISYLVYGGREDAQSGEITLDSTVSDHCKAVENAVYDNAFLLDDYSKTTIALHSQHFQLMPQELVEAGLARKVLDASFTTIEGDILTCPIDGTDAAIACDTDGGIVGFMRRTFPAATLLHHLAPLCSYCVKAYAEETGCLHINLNDKEAHIVVVKQGKLQMANTFAYRSLEDVAYYALNSWKTCGMESRRDKVMLTGDNALRTELAEQLRQWIAYVMPEVMPASVLKLGRNATTLPFNLITLVFSNQRSVISFQ